MAISDHELREMLISYGFNPPPVTDNSREILMKKLKKLESVNTSVNINGSAELKSRKFRLVNRNEKPLPDTYNSFVSTRNNSLGHPSNRRDIEDLDFEGKRVINSTPVSDKGIKHDPFEQGSDDDCYTSRPVSQTSLLARKPLSIRRDTELFSSPVFSRKYESDKGASSYLNRPIKGNKFYLNKNASVTNITTKFSLHKITPTVILFAFSCFFISVAFIYFSKNDQVRGELFTDDAVKPLCSKQGMEGVSCIVDKDMNVSLDSLKSVYRWLHNAYVDAVCSGNERATTKLFYDDAIELLIREFTFLRYEADSMIKNLVVLISTNPQFKMIWSEKDRIFSLQSPDLSWWCKYKLWLFVFFGYTFQLLLTFGLLLSTYYLFQWYRIRHSEHDKGTQDLVKGILEIVQQHALANNKQSFIPIVHVRDQLISYSDRDRKKKLWAAAEKYIEENESRIRREMQPIQGEDHNVWRWLGGLRQSSSPKPKTWQGEAFETSNDNMNTPLTSLTPCLKIRNMFNVKIESPSGDWVTVVKDAVLERCETVNIVHMSVDEASSDGCVYIKCASSEDAGKAYRKMHGAWFDGQIVSVKYLRLERYHERFPNAVNFTVPLVPSNDQKRSIV